MERPQTESGAIVRHLAKELREPLDAIESISFYLDMAMPRGQARARRQLNALQEQVRHINWILADAMHFLEDGPLRRELLDLGELVDKNFSEWKPAEGPAIRLRLEPDLPPVALDLIHMQHLLRSVAGFFRRAAAPDGEIVVCTCAAQGEVVLEFRSVLVAGTNLNEFDHLFEPYATPSRGAAGLGLASVRKIIDAHSGRIELHSGTGGDISLRLAFSVA